MAKAKRTITLTVDGDSGKISIMDEVIIAMMRAFILYHYKPGVNATLKIEKHTTKDISLVDEYKLDGPLV